MSQKKKTLSIIPTFFLWGCALFFLCSQGIFPFYKSIRSNNAKRQNSQHVAVRYPVTTEHPITVVIASYNNSKYCITNMQSVLDQTYKNYRIIFIDDCSKDNTFDLVKDFVAYRGAEDRCTLIKNETRQLKMTNIYRGIHLCKDNEIVAVLDGDDWFPSENVLEKVNSYYQNPDVWITYGSTIQHPKYKKDKSNYISPMIIQDRLLRTQEQFQASMLRTFYAGLFKSIPLEQLVYNGDFLGSTDDVAYMYSMFELAPDHVRFVNDLLYVINDENPLRSHLQENNLQTFLYHKICSRAPCEPLPSLFHPTSTVSQGQVQSLPMLILSNSTPELLQRALESYQYQIDPISSISVLYAYSTKDEETSYLELQRGHPNVSFYTKTSLSRLLREIHWESFYTEESPYMLIASDQFTLPDPMSLKHPLRTLDLSSLNSFFLAASFDFPEGRSLLNGEAFCDIERILERPGSYQDHYMLLTKRSSAEQILNSQHDRGSLIYQIASSETLALFSKEPKATYSPQL